MAVYNVEDPKLVARIFDTKLKYCKDCYHKWQRFLYYEEDLQLRDEKWNLKYNNKRVIFHNNTGILISKPSDSWL